jgi:hypothetical protein
MHISLKTSSAEQLSVDALAVICFETDEATESQLSEGMPPAVPKPTVPDPEIAGQSGWLAELRTSGEFTGKLYESRKVLDN